MPRPGLLLTPSETFVFITTLFNQGSFMSVSARPPGAAPGCDKSAAAPQGTNQHSQGKNNTQVQTTKGLEEPEGSLASRKNGPHQNNQPPNHPYLLGLAGLALGDIIEKPPAHKLFSLDKGTFLIKLSPLSSVPLIQWIVLVPPARKHSGKQTW